MLDDAPWSCIQVEVIGCAVMASLAGFVIFLCGLLLSRLSRFQKREPVVHDGGSAPCVQVPITGVEGCKGQDISAPTINPLLTNVCTTTKIKLILTGHLTSIVTKLPVSVARLAMNAVYDFGAGWGYPSMLDVQDVKVRGGEGHNVLVRVYTPYCSAGASQEKASTSAQKVPVILYLHGGAFISGNIDTHDNVCRILAHETKYVTVSVDYRLSPEHSGHAAVNDATDVYKWIARMGRELHSGAWVEPQIIVSGDSAGGLLTCSLCMKLHMEREALIEQHCDPQLLPAMPFMQVPLYPPASATSNYPSHAKYGKGWMLSELVVKYAIRLYFGSAILQHDPVLVPLVAPLKDLACMPPTLLITAEHDYLHDEGVAYVNRLQVAGVRCQHYEAIGLIHGFLNFTGVSPRALHCTRHIAKLIKSKAEQGARLAQPLSVSTAAGENRKRWMENWHSWLQPTLVAPSTPAKLGLTKPSYSRSWSMPLSRSATDTDMSFASTPRRERDESFWKHAASDSSKDALSVPSGSDDESCASKEEAAQVACASKNNYSSSVQIGAGQRRSVRGGLGGGVREEGCEAGEARRSGRAAELEEDGRDAEEEDEDGREESSDKGGLPMVSLHSAVSLRSLYLASPTHSNSGTWHAGQIPLATLSELPVRQAAAGGRRQLQHTHSAPACASVWTTHAASSGSEDGDEEVKSQDGGRAARREAGEETQSESSSDPDGRAEDGGADAEGVAGAGAEAGVGGIGEWRRREVEEAQQRGAMGFVTPEALSEQDIQWSPPEAEQQLPSAQQQQQQQDEHAKGVGWLEARELEGRLLAEKRELEEMKLKRVALALTLCKSYQDCLSPAAARRSEEDKSPGGRSVEEEARGSERGALCERARRLQQEAKAMMTALETEIEERTENLEVAVGLMEQFEAGSEALLQGTEDAARKMMRLMQITREHVVGRGRHLLN